MKNKRTSLSFSSPSTPSSLPQTAVLATPFTPAFPEKQEDSLQKAFARAALRCARLMLGATEASVAMPGDEFLSKIITTCCAHTTYHELISENENIGAPLFVVSAPDDTPSKEKEGQSILLSVIEDTSLQLPSDPITGQIYIPLSGQRRLTYPVTLDSLQNLTSAPNSAKPVPKTHSLAQLAQKALTEPYNPTSALLCLKRKYIPLSPAPRDVFNAVNKEHNETKKKFRRAAIHICIRKWRSILPPEILIDHFANTPFDSHHRLPKFWGGGNKSRSLCNLSLHQDIHTDFDRTIRQVENCLIAFNAPVIRFDEATPDTLADLKKFLSAHEDATDALRKISHVRVNKGVLSAGLLWPEEIFCIPQLLVFESLNRSALAPSMGAHDTGKGDEISALSKKGAPRAHYFLPKASLCPTPAPA